MFVSWTNGHSTADIASRQTGNCSAPHFTYEHTYLKATNENRMNDSQVSHLE